MRRLSITLILLLVLTGFALSGIVLADDAPVVHAVLFYSPTCPHCHEVITNSLPPIVDKYGDQLQIVLINVDTEGGQQLYRSAMAWVPLPAQVTGVPLMIVGREYLYGSIEIPARLPGIVAAGLAAGGIDWPAMPGMEAVVAQIEAQQAQAETDVAEPAPAVEDQQPAVEDQQPAVEPETTIAPEPVAVAVTDPADIAAATDLTLAERLALDPTANAIAILVLALMLVSLIVVAISWLRQGPAPASAQGWQIWIVPVLALIGLGVAAYLAFVETTETAAVCGPVGDCNAVQQSQYARLFGVPIGVLGVAGYLAILIVWAWQRFNPAAAQRTRWILPALALFGVVFNIYLTFLEPFVIGAVCMWCITSALIMTALLWISHRWGAYPPQPPPRSKP